MHRSATGTPLFRRTTDYRAFLATVRDGLGHHPVRLISYCVLSHHWHLVMGPADARTVAALIRWVTTTHTDRLRRTRDTAGRGLAYRSRFWTDAIDAPGGLLRTCRYVERHAVRTGLVRRAEDWPWCSLAERFRFLPRLPLVTTPFLASATWVEHVNKAQTLRELSLAGPHLHSRCPRLAHADDLELHDFSQDPGEFSGGAKPLDRPVHVGGRHHEHQADTHVERAEHLRI
jgi:putative transposase